MAAFLILIYLLLITPVYLGAAAQAGNGGRPEGAVAVMIWGVRAQVNYALQKDENGKVHFISTFRGKSKEADAGKPSQNVLRLLKTLIRGNVARGLLRRTVYIREFSLQVHVGGMSAASVALWTAALQTAGALQHILRIDARPAFRDAGGVLARCIVETRLGTIMAAGLLGRIGFLVAGKKEEIIWNIPSET